MDNRRFPIEKLIGRRSGRLVVLREGKPIITRALRFIKFYEYKKRMIDCQCDCGNIITITPSKFMSGKYKSCGCLDKDHRAANKDRLRDYCKNQMPESERERRREQARKMALKNRKYEEVCTNCGKEEHYAHGLCRNCYHKQRRTGDFDRRGTQAAQRAELERQHEEAMAKKRNDRIKACNPNTDRGREFLKLYAKGKTLQEIADMNNITRERVRQIMKGK